MPPRLVGHVMLMARRALRDLRRRCASIIVVNAKRSSKAQVRIFFTEGWTSRGVEVEKRRSVKPYITGCEKPKGCKKLV
jgi:hypothetical protein